jgi:cobalt-zinc-cadmium efflux system outer membrane protein
MHSKWLNLVLLAAIAVCGGCRTASQSVTLHTPRPIASRLKANEWRTSDIGLKKANPERKSKARPTSVRHVAFEQNDSTEENTLGLIVAQAPADDCAVPIGTVAATQVLSPTTLARLEQTALATNPAVTEIEAEIESLRGKLTQAGLPPNPRVGINAEDIFEDGSAGRYGVFFGREVVRGNKLGRSASVVCAEIEAAEQQRAVVRQRLLTDVRQRYYDLLVTQETVAMTATLVEISQNMVDVSTKLVEAQEAAKTSVLQSEIELQNAIVVKRQAENRRLAARRKLAGLLGETELSLDRVDGNPREILAAEDFEQSYDKLLSSSPEIAAVFAEVEQKRRQLDRAIVEPIPNVTWQTTIQYDTVSDNVVGGFQVGIPIPTLNQNQGAIHQARHQIIAAQRRAEKKALDLRQRLADAYESYLDAKLQVDAYDSEIIPKSKQTLDLITMGYKEGEIDFLQLLTAQRTYSQINLSYLQQLQQAWRQNVAIKGMLLSDSLSE